MLITGKYEEDANFFTVYSNNTMYTITKNTDNWASLSVGGTSATGHVLTQAVYDRLEAACEEEGAFELSEQDK